MALFAELERSCKVIFDDDDYSYLKSDDVEAYLKSLSSERHEKAIAEGMISGSYNWKHAKFVTELQGLDWAKVEQEYNRMYEQEQRAGAGSWN